MAEILEDRVVPALFASAITAPTGGNGSFGVWVADFNASVITSQADNAITVLNSAIVRRAGQTFVNLLQNGKQALTQVTLGVVGTTTTQVLTGLKAGDTVVLPTATVSGGATGLGGRLTTGGGGGGRGFGGGGAGLGG